MLSIEARQKALECLLFLTPVGHLVQLSKKNRAQPPDARHTDSHEIFRNF